MNSRSVLITGASGLIGTRLTEILLQANYRVCHLSRSKNDGNVPTFLWDVEREWIEPGAFAEADAIIHLAGAGIADEPWTEKRKQEIIDSRVKSSELIRNTLAESNHRVKVFISASGINYYGTSDELIFTEADPPGDDFLANVVRLWEQGAEKFKSLGIRDVELRTGMVLSDKGGALAEFVKPIKWFVGAPLGSGNQWIGWIHIDDLCRMYQFAVENDSMQGAYNAVAPNPVMNRVLMKTLANVLRKPLILPPVPKFALKLLLGEMVSMVVEGSRVSPAKIQREGFQFTYKNIAEALRDLLGQSTQVRTEENNA